MRSAVTEPAQDGLREMLARLSERMGVRRAVRLMQSAMVQAPTVIGWLRPVVLIPVGCLTGLSAAQVEAILAHELAHIRRHDYLVSVIQSVVEALLFYHPAVWWVSKQMRRERESCCDDVAVKLSGDRIAYARALSWLEEHRAAAPELVLGANGGVLTMRIKRLLGYGESPVVSRGVAMTLLAGVVAGAVWYAGAVARAQSNQAQPSAAQSAAQTPASPAVVAPSAAAGAPQHEATQAERPKALESEPEFRDLTPEEQQHVRERVARLDAMSAVMQARADETARRAQEVTARLNSPEFKKQMADAMASVAKVNSPEFRKQYEEAQRAAGDINDAKVREMVSKIYTKEFQKSMADAGAAAARVNTPELQKEIYASMKAVEDANMALLKVQPYQLLAQSNVAAAAAQEAAGVAQGNGSIAGVIVDPTGALVPRAQVTATNIDTGVTIMAVTDNTGRYLFSGLPPGPYNVEVVAKGFKRLLQENVHVAAKQQVELDIKLTVNAESTSISVTGAPAGVSPGQLPTIVVEAPASNLARPQRVSAGVVEGNLIYKVDPVYPDIAKKAHVQGAVVLQAVIAKDGTVKNLTLISGAPMLVVSAIEAVQQWKYKPYILNGEPTEVETTITVNYSFSPDQGQPGVSSLTGGSESPKSIPVPLYVVQPEYTQQAREAKVSGVVLVNLVVDEQGRPQNVHILRGLGDGLDEKAVEAVKQYKFKPAMVDGTPVPVTLNVEVNFKLF